MHENRTILIVDDEAETLRGYQDFLTPKEEGPARKSSRVQTGSAPSKTQELEKYDLLLAKSGEDAIVLVKNELAKGRRVAAGFFDVKLEGGIDGLTTIQEIKKLDKDIHCVVVTAYHDRTVDEINLLFGEDFRDQWDYLNKPFTQGEIVQKARQMVAAWNRKKELEVVHAQLVRAERSAAIAQIARGIGHEFGNLLLRIMGKTDLALMEDNVEKIHGHLKVIMSAAERAGAVVHNLQTFSKIQANPTSEKITKPIDEALTLVEHELSKNQIKVEKDYAPIENQKIDPGAMVQVFLNLFINASHAMPQGGSLTVSVEGGMDHETRRNGAIVQVADSGTGIPPEVLPRIFEFAFTTKGEKGSGLGLSVTKEIVEAHQGKISVTTEVGKGTTFSIWIPNIG